MSIYHDPRELREPLKRRHRRIMEAIRAEREQQSFAICVRLHSRRSPSRDTHRVMPEESTTPDLVEVVTGLFEAADRGDWDAVIAPYAPDVIWESDDGILDVASASGVRGLLEEWAGVFEDFKITVETVVELGNGIVFSVFRQEARPVGSTGVVKERGAMIYEWVDGMIARVIVRQDIDEARAAAERLAESRG
jgi:ketosteroid isomerase-like protein